MATLKDLKNRISSVKSTRKITKAMQMVAASKLRRAQDAVENARPFAERMGQVIANLSKSEPENAPKLMTGTGEEQTHLLLVCTSERGLAGGFNANIVKLVRQRIKALRADGKTVKIICVGKKGHDILRRDFGDLIVDRIDMREVRNLNFDDADDIGEKVIDMFHAGEFDVCTIFYAEFENALTQHPRGMQLIPVNIDELPSVESEDQSGEILYEYEPDEGTILQDIVPRNISVQIFRALLENVASENGARMTAMDNATRNAEDMIDDLNLQYNRQRQAKITTELIEIISGAEAL